MRFLKKRVPVFDTHRRTLWCASDESAPKDASPELVPLAPYGLARVVAVVIVANRTVARIWSSPKIRGLAHQLHFWVDGTVRDWRLWQGGHLLPPFARVFVLFLDYSVLIRK